MDSPFAMGDTSFVPTSEMSRFFVEFKWFNSISPFLRPWHTHEPQWFNPSLDVDLTWMNLELNLTHLYIQ